MNNNMNNKQYTIRNMSRSDLDIAIDWAAQEGWNPGLHDTQCFYAADPRGFFMGFVDDQPIASISVVAYNATYGFLGFYIVKPEFRGHDYGIQIWRHAMAYAGNRNLGLDGIADQQSNYIKSGFKLAYHNVTLRGVSKKYPPNSHVVDLKTIDFQQILDYDHDCFPAPRSQFLNCWINGPERTALGYVDADELKGYGVVRKCRSWYKIGPLFANDKQIAEELFRGLISSIPQNSEIGIDAPEVNQQALELAKRNNLTEEFRLGRMYTKAPPKINLSKIFSVTSYELG